ncbi:DUF4386 domain-containing protein [Spirochaeta isovalerica]|uniref:DUF4386 domain-containing protein n=1 Tax=Spirochaeta isovalerica TaxID=150 RepID=A0A841RBF0_9SPIO|nr:DUF4386 domain-containing protein [Spirochaeta isovalerica]MBB6480340.1 hypothetical protein [Spirochaeta isovalerica]
MKSNKQKYIFDNGQKRAALWTGISLIIMAVSAGIAYGAIHGQLFISGDSEATGLAVQSNPALLQAEIALWVVILLTDIIVSVKLYSFFKPAGRGLSLSAALLRLIYSALLATAIIFLLRSLNPEVAYENMSLFSRIWSIGLIVFGVHLTLLAVLAFKSRFVPLFLSILLIIAGPAYSLIHMLYNSGPQFETMAVLLEKILSVPMASAELLLALWLLIIAFSGRKAVS